MHRYKYKRISLIFFGFLISNCLSFSSYAQEKEKDWELVKEEEGILVYTRPTDTDLDEFKGITQIQSPLASLVSITNDTPSFTRWFHNCTEATLLKKTNDFERYTLMVNDVPWPVTDRDLVVHSKIEQDPQTKIVTMHLKATPKLTPPNPELVRIPAMQGYWKFTPLKNGKTEVVLQVYMDPGGSIPGWLANITAVDLPYFTLLNMKEVIQESKYQQAHYEWLRE